MTGPNIPEIAERLRPHLPALVANFRGPHNPAWSSSRELRWGSKGSLAVALSGPHAGKWVDWSDDGRSRDALDLICRERSCNLPEAARWAAEWLGLPESERQPVALPTVARIAPAEDADAMAHRRAKRNLAAVIWRDAVPIMGTPAAVYLAGRNIPADVIADVSGDALRFMPDCPRATVWRDGKLIIARRAPAMVGLVRNVETGEGQAIHRTFIKPDGGGKIADGGPDRLALGSPKGGAVMLSAFDAVTLGLHIAEGIETALSVMALGFTPCWSMLNAGNLAALPVLSGVDALTVFADCDAAKGPRQKRAGQEAAQAVVDRWTEAGREAIAYAPPVEGSDWNDVAGEAA